MLPGTLCTVVRHPSQAWTSRSDVPRQAGAINVVDHSRLSDLPRQPHVRKVSFTLSSLRACASLTDKLALSCRYDTDSQIRHATCRRVGIDASLLAATACVVAPRDVTHPKHSWNKLSFSLASNEGGPTDQSCAAASPNRATPTQILLRGTRGPFAWVRGSVTCGVQRRESTVRA